jgi:hypothetical protein
MDVEVRIQAIEERLSEVANAQRDQGKTMQV